MAALRALQQNLRLAENDAAIAPLGTPGKRDGGKETLLAGRFGEEKTGIVRSVVNDNGGLVVADVDEQWTRPRMEIVESVQAAASPRSASRERPTRTRRTADPRLARQPIVQ